MIVVTRWTLVTLGIAGAILNARGMRASFIVWVVANAGMLSLNVATHRYPEAILFGVYLLTAVYGWLHWGRKP
jgi:nicotinamide riboside transporter PnuC